MSESPAATPPTAPPRPDNWIWVDIETTCLDERSPDAAILEIGLIAVDARLNEVAHWASPVKFMRGDLADVLRRNGTLEMHQNSGLYRELTSDNRATMVFEAGGLPTLEQAEAVAIQFVQAFAPPVFEPRRNGNGQYMVQGSPICGANVGAFDRTWLRAKMPKLVEMFHYRSYDSNFTFMSEQRFGGGPSTKGEVRHRALEDCRQSINTVRKFFGLGPLPTGGV